MKTELPERDPMGDMIRKITPEYNPTRYGKDPDTMKTYPDEPTPNDEHAWKAWWVGKIFKPEEPFTEGMRQWAHKCWLETLAMSEPSPYKVLPTYTIRIYLSGSIEAAKQIIREHVLHHPLCVTVEPTTFIYTGGEEQGYVVGLLNYPRFPTAPNELNVRANILAEMLLERTFQRSALIVTPTDTKWVTLESLTQ